MTSSVAVNTGGGSFWWKVPWSTARVVGPDAERWLNGVLTADVVGLPAGVATSSLLLTKQGKLRTLLALLPTSEGIVLGAQGVEAAELVRELDHYLVMEDAEIELVPSAVWTLSFGLPFPVGETSGIYGGAYPLLGAGAEVVVDWSGTDRVQRGLEKAGGEEDEARFEARRLDFGYPLFGVDYSTKDNPHEAGLERTLVSWSKGCYLGQEVVCMQDMRGKVKRRLVRISSETPLNRGDKLCTTDGNEVGEITSSLAKVGLARVNAPAYEPGTRLFSATGVVCHVEALRAGEPRIERSAGS